MPRVPVFDLEIHPRDDDLIAGTHGRGIWILDDVGVLPAMTQDAVSRGLALSPIKPATLFQHALDIPRLGHGAFRAPNPVFGAVITYYLRDDVDEDVIVRVSDGGGRVLRTMTGPGTRGIHRLAWDLRLQPLAIDTSAFELGGLDVGPHGPFVMAGTYGVEVQAGSLVATESVEVRTDPAMPISPSEQRARYDFTVDLYRLQADEYHASVQANLLERAAETAIEDLGDLVDEVQSRVDAVMEPIAEAAEELRSQNNTLRSWWRGLVGEFDGGLNSQGTMTGPTEAQIRRYEEARAEFGEAVEELDMVILEIVPELNALLEELQGGPVQVPVRGGVELVT